MSDVDVWRAIRAIEDDLERLRKADVGGVVVTWTPTYIGLTTAGVTTYSIQVGSYMLLDKLIIATATIIWTGATGTGDALFSLPFAAANVANQVFSGAARLESLTFANSTPTIQIGAAQAIMRLNSPITNAASTNVAMEAAGNVAYTVAYFID